MKKLISILLALLMIGITMCIVMEVKTQTEKEAAYDKIESRACVQNFLTSVENEDYDEALLYIDMPEVNCLTSGYLSRYAVESEFKSMVMEPRRLAIDKTKSGKKSMRYTITNDIDIFTLDLKKNKKGQWKVYLKDFYIDNWYIETPGNINLKLNEIEIPKNQIVQKNDIFDLYCIPAVPNEKINIAIEGSLFGVPITEKTPVKNEKDQPETAYFYPQDYYYDLMFDFSKKAMSYVANLQNKNENDSNLISCTVESQKENLLTKIKKLMNPIYQKDGKKLPIIVSNVKYSNFRPMQWKKSMIIGSSNIVRMYIKCEMEWTEIKCGKTIERKEYRNGWIDIILLDNQLYIYNISDDLLEIKAPTSEVDFFPNFIKELRRGK